MGEFERIRGGSAGSAWCKRASEPGCGEWVWWSGGAGVFVCVRGASTLVEYERRTCFGQDVCAHREFLHKLISFVVHLLSLHAHHSAHTRSNPHYVQVSSVSGASAPSTHPGARSTGSDAPAPGTHVCDRCRRALLGKGGACSRCKAVRYCSRECQVADWAAGHKSMCKPPA
jgi:hypothetical protein